MPVPLVDSPGVHRWYTINCRSGQIIPAMPDGSRAVPGRRSLAELSPSGLREWLPGVFAARLLAGVRLSSGRIAGETDRVVHLFPIPSGRVDPERLRAFCGLAIHPGDAELVTVGTGLPCVACVLAAPDPPDPAR